jgi:hypothetical protein
MQPVWPSVNPPVNTRQLHFKPRLMIVSFLCGTAETFSPMQTHRANGSFVSPVSGEVGSKDSAAREGTSFL